METLTLPDWVCEELTANARERFPSFDAVINDYRAIKHTEAETAFEHLRGVDYVRTAVRVSFEPFVFDRVVDCYIGNGEIEPPISKIDTAEMLESPCALRGIEVMVRARTSRVWHQGQWYPVDRKGAKTWTIGVGKTAKYELVEFGYCFMVRSRDFNDNARWLCDFKRMTHALREKFSINSIHPSNYDLGGLPFQRKK